MSKRLVVTVGESTKPLAFDETLTENVLKKVLYFS